MIIQIMNEIIYDYENNVDYDFILHFLKFYTKFEADGLHVLFVRDLSRNRK